MGVMAKRIPVSKLTPELPFIATIRGLHVFGDGFTFSLDESLSEEAICALINYMCEEGFIVDAEAFVFLS